MPKQTPKILPAIIEAVVPAEPNVTEQASQAFTTILHDLLVSQAPLDEAKGDYDGEVARHGSVKIDLMRNLADLAAEGNWEYKYAVQGIDAALAAYVKASNNPQRANSLKTFAGECARCVHPKTRQFVEDDFADAKEAWDAEGEAVAKVRSENRDGREAAKAAGEKFTPAELPATPLRDTYKRMYHMVVGSNGMLAKRMSDDESVASLPDDLEAMAEADAARERKDPKRAAKALQRAVDAIDAVFAEFPSPELKLARDYVAAIEPKDLEALAAELAAKARIAAKKAETAAKMQARVAGKRPAAPAAKIDPAALDDATDAVIPQ